MAENFPELMKDINIHIQEVQQIPSMINKKKSTPRNITEFRKTKVKEVILKSARGKKVTFKGTAVRLTDTRKNGSQGQ